MRLVDYSYFLVRVRCETCRRSRQSKLARPAAKHGCEITLGELLERISRDCPWRKDGAFTNSGCGIYCADIPPKVPPNLPPGMVRLRIEKAS
jgi:hypothetical protein